ncbi:hypothetical protein HDU76_002136 [Blyttiomyces sp. JEL0837]|nr:hypothetical protein HDU76_002136 [Blyttiomyces sp. JEL0837]
MKRPVPPPLPGELDPADLIIKRFKTLALNYDPSASTAALPALPAHLDAVQDHQPSRQQQQQQQQQQRQNQQQHQQYTNSASHRQFSIQDMDGSESESDDDDDMSTSDPASPADIDEFDSTDINATLVKIQSMISSINLEESHKPTKRSKTELQQKQYSEAFRCEAMMIEALVICKDKLLELYPGPIIKEDGSVVRVCELSKPEQKFAFSGFKAKFYARKQLGRLRNRQRKRFNNISGCLMQLTELKRKIWSDELRVNEDLLMFNTVIRVAVRIAKSFDVFKKITPV